MNKDRLKALSVSLFPYALYAVVVLVLFLISKYTIHSDGVDIMDTGRHWAEGRFMVAVNSLWPPLLSVILGIFDRIISNEVIAFKVVAMLLGIPAMIFSDLLSRKWIENKWVRLIALSGLAFFFAEYCLRDTTNDFCAMVVTLWYAWLVTREKFMFKKWSGLWLGIAWALLYFARTYLIYFAFAHIVFMVAYEWWLDKDRAVRKLLIRNALISLGVFIVVASPWVIALHAKYHRWMIGISGPFNYYKYNYEAVGAPRQNAYTGDHLIPPAVPDDSSAYTDPDNQIPTAWSPFQSRQAFTWQVLRVWKNLKVMFAGVKALRAESILPTFSPLMAASILAYLIYLIAKRDWKGERKGIILMGMTLIYPLGYLIIEVNDRYFLALVVFAMLMGAYVLEKLLPNHKKVLVASVILLALTYVPFTQMKDLKEGYYFYSKMRDDGLYIKSHLPTEGKRAATMSGSESKDLRTFFYAGIPYYWYLNPDVSIKDVVNELCSNKIDYIFTNNTNVESNPKLQARYAYLRAYFYGELQLPDPEHSLLYDSHLPCPKR